MAQGKYEVRSHTVYKVYLKNTYTAVAEFSTELEAIKIAGNLADAFEDGRKAQEVAQLTA